MGTRVLLAEDEPLTACSFADLLEAEGFDVVLAADGAEALDAARRLGDALGALVTDLRMPRMGGEDLIRALRAERPGLPVVVVTGSAPSGGAEALRRGAGGDGLLMLLHKPTCGGQLAAALLRAIAAGSPRPAADRTGAAADAPASGTAAADDMAVNHAGSFFSTGVFAFGPGVRSPGPTPFRTTGNDTGYLITGGTATGRLHGCGGDDILVGGAGEAAWMEDGTGNGAHEANGAAGRGGDDRVALASGDGSVRRADEVLGAVRARVDLAPSGPADRPIPTGGARRGHGDEASDMFVGDSRARFVAGPGDDRVRSSGGDARPVNGRVDRVL